MASLIKGIEEGRAVYAYNHVVRLKDNSEAKKYKSYVKRIPMMIKRNGLGPAIAFIYSKGNVGMGKKDSDNAYKIIYGDIREFLVKKKLLDPEKELIEKIVEVDTTEYRELTHEILALFTWLRRFVDGMIEGD